MIKELGNTRRAVMAANRLRKIQKKIEKCPICREKLINDLGKKLFAKEGDMEHKSQILYNAACESCKAYHDKMLEGL